MLIKRPSTNARMREMPSMQQSQLLIKEASRDLKLLHRRRPLISLAHQRQQRCIFLLITLILLQQVEVHKCRLLSKRGNRRRDSINDLASSSSSSISDNVVDTQNFDSPTSISKRAELSHESTSAGQPEEIFTVDDQTESNYDEYPMIVPKRAALLLDRLMVALHHALEQELNKEQQNGPSNFDNMYGDDPTVLMDYDFKDLNSINRATGEALIGKSFQRRANVGGADGLALKSALASGAVLKGSSKDILNAASGGGGGGGVSSLNGGRINTGRMYWRCYFNAVSCF